MAALARNPADPVIDRLAGRLTRTDFYQSVRLLLQRPGGRVWPLEQRVRFAADMSHAFPGHEITGLATLPGTADQPSRYRLATPNYSVAGGLGPLPEAYADWLREQARNGHPAALQFLDLFNHRLNALRYRLKESRSMALENRAPEHSQLGVTLSALCGLDAASPAALPRRAWLGIASHVVERRKSAAGLISSITRYLGVAVRLTPLIGAWRDIAACDRTTLGRGNHALGSRTVLGSRMWDQAARIRLVIGPLDDVLFRRLLPPLPGQAGDPLFEGLVALVRMLGDRRHDCEIRLEVRPETVGESKLTADAGIGPQAVPPTTLTGASARGANTGLRLGATAWLNRPNAAPHAEYLIPAYGPVVVEEARG